MRDNNYKDLSGKGWRMMESILDNEMPKKKNKNRLFIIILLCLLGIGGLSFYISNTDFSAEESVVIQDRIQEQIGISELTHLPTTSKNQNVKSAYSDIELSSDKTLNQSQDFHLKGKRSQLNSDNNTLNNRNKVNEAKYVNLPFAENSKIDNENSTNTKQSEEVLLSKTAESIVEVEKLSNAYLTPIIPIAQKDIRAILTNQDYVLPYSPIKVIKDQRPLYIRLYAGYSLPMYSEINGPEFGLNLGKDISRRWGVEIGIHFLLSNKNYNILSMNRLDLDSNAGFVSQEILEDYSGTPSLTEMGKSTVDTKYYSLVTEKITKLYFLNIPLQFDYKLTSRHQLGLGFQYHYLLTADNDKINLSELVPSLSFNNSYLKESILIEQKLLNRHNLSIKGQYRFLITQKLGVTLAGNLGVRKILKTEASLDSRNRMSYMHLGVDYRL